MRKIVFQENNNFVGEKLKSLAIDAWFIGRKLVIMWADSGLSHMFSIYLEKTSANLQQ